MNSSIYSKFPAVSKLQFVLIQVEVKTGVVLTLEETKYLGDGEIFFVFNDKESAFSFAKKKVKENPLIECAILDAQRNLVAEIRNEEYINDFMMNAVNQRKRKWWQFWKR